jgi:5'-3' exonuclease
MYILIDTSYFVFFRYFATLRWYQLKYPDVAASPGEDQQFIAAFLKHVDDTLAKICKPHAAASIVFCRDCPRAEIWRMRDYGEYKGTRATPAAFDKRIFPIFYDHLVARGLPCIGAAALEADDIVYLCCRHIRECYGDEPQILCYSNDNDYLQLLQIPNVRVVNLQGTDLATRSCGCPQKDILIKALSGDKSDNIPVVCRGLGPKTAAKLADMSAEDRATWLSKKGGAAALETLERNLRLVDFAHIPRELAATVSFDAITQKMI